MIFISEIVWENIHYPDAGPPKYLVENVDIFLFIVADDFHIGLGNAEIVQKLCGRSKYLVGNVNIFFFMLPMVFISVWEKGISEIVWENIHYCCASER